MYDMCAYLMYGQKCSVGFLLLVVMLRKHITGKNVHALGGVWEH